MGAEELMPEELKVSKKKIEEEVIWNQIIPNELVVICKSYKEDVIMNLGKDDENEIKTTEPIIDVTQDNTPPDLS